MKKTVYIILLVIIIAFMALSPPFIMEGLDKNIFNLKEKDQKSQYTGNIELWHVVSFKTGKGSGYSMLKARSERFEKSKPYVFVNVQGITLDDAAARLMKGERPDIISFPSGSIDTAKMVDLDIPDNIIDGLDGVCDNCIPYMYDSYVLLVNGDMLANKGISRPMSGEMPSELFDAALRGLLNCSDSSFSLVYSELAYKNKNKIMEHRFLSDETVLIDDGITYGSYTDGIDESHFVSGNVPMFICPYSEYKSITENGNLVTFNVLCYPISYYTDLVQCIGVYNSDDTSKIEMCSELALSLLKNGFQKQLEDIEMFPVIELENIYENNYERSAEYIRLTENGIFK